MKLENVSSKYGAPMGRHSTCTLESMTGKVHLRRVDLNMGGYDNGGAYWGSGAPIWQVESETDVAYFRASNRTIAKTKLPNARFFR